MSDATADMSLQESCMDALRHLSVEIHLLTAKTNRLEQENTKLRELAGRMLGSIRRFEVCSDSYRVSSVYEQWMRELGIEVDE